MQVVCAWCAQAGEPSVLSHKPPLEDTSLTHGICAEHLAAVRAEMRARVARSPIAADAAA